MGRQVDELIREAQNGSEYAFEKLLELANPMIMKYVRKYSHATRDDPEDLYQIASIALWEAIKSFNSRNPRFFSYARVVILRALFNHIRDEAKRISITRLSIPWDDIRENTLFNINESELDELLYVYDMIKDSLNEKEREILDLYFIKDVGIGGIADYYGIKNTAASQRVYRALSVLRNKYKEDALNEC